LRGQKSLQIKQFNYTWCALNSETTFCNRTRAKLDTPPTNQRLSQKKSMNLNDTLFNGALDAVFNSTDYENAETENYIQSS